ncbi:Uncharacterised protein [Vibrio cholerae]|nr:Uncharacterised protein [Vibrio cholerae]
MVSILHWLMKPFIRLSICCVQRRININTLCPRHGQILSTIGKLSIQLSPFIRMNGSLSVKAK